MFSKILISVDVYLRATTLAPLVGLLFEFELFRIIDIERGATPRKSGDDILGFRGEY